jgi:DNA-binding CsgD family transcriptional regulator
MIATVNANIWNILNSEPTNPGLESVLARTLGVLCGEEDAHQLRHWWTKFWACINRIIKETTRKLRARAFQEEATSEIKARLFELVHEYKAQAYMHLAHDRAPKTFTDFLRDKVRELIRYMRKVPAIIRRQFSKAVAKYGPGEQLVELPAEDGDGNGTVPWSAHRDDVAATHARLTVAAVKQSLTERQRNIVDMVVEEHESVSTIAQRLDMREHTIKRDLQKILQKVGVLTVLLVLCLSAALLTRHGSSSEDALRMASAVDDHTGESPHEPHTITATVDRPPQGGAATAPEIPPDLWSRGISRDILRLAAGAQMPARPDESGMGLYEYWACLAKSQSAAESGIDLKPPGCDAMALNFSGIRLCQGKVFRRTFEIRGKQTLLVPSGSSRYGSPSAQANSEDRNLSRKRSHSSTIPEQGEWLDAAKCLELEARDAKSVISLISAYVAHGDVAASELLQLKKSSAQKLEDIELARKQLLALLRDRKLPTGERDGINGYKKIVEAFAREARLLLRSIGFLPQASEQS